jgi:hypothetical protein
MMQILILFFWATIVLNLHIVRSAFGLLLIINELITASQEKFGTETDH